jgi:acetyl-CoA carboxylase beta subunit
MTAAFDNERGDDQNPSLSQENDGSGASTIQQTLPLKGTLPLYCHFCEEVRYTKDLTVCPLCGSSSVTKAAVIHYALLCDKDEHDKYDEGVKSKLIQK